MYTIGGVSERVDGCMRMLVGKAAMHHRRLSVADKKWLDPEDLMQEGMLKALEAERLYDKARDTKFSTYLWIVTDRHLLKLAAALRQQKRTQGEVVELDVVREGVPVQVAAQQGMLSAARENGVSDQFITLCQALVRYGDDGQRAIALMVRVLLFGDVKVHVEESVYAAIRAAALEQHTTFDDLWHLSRAIVADELFRRKLLTMLAEHVMISEDTEESSLRVLECTECNGKFSLAAIRDRRFIVNAMTCAMCYGKMARDPSTCFGKDKHAAGGGYDVGDASCRLHCPDKEPCRAYIKGEMVMANDKKTVDGVPFDDIEEKSKAKDKAATKPKAEAKVKGKKAEKKKGPVAVAKAEKKGKPKAEAKAKADDRGEPPTGVEKWPYRNNSAMDFVFRQMLTGVDKKVIQKKVEDNGGNWGQLLKIMARPNHREHTWKLDEQGSRYRIYDVKYTGEKIKKAAKEKAA